MCNNQLGFDFTNTGVSCSLVCKQFRGRVMYARLSRVSSRLVSRYVKLAAASSSDTLESYVLPWLFDHSYFIFLDYVY